MVLYRLKWIKSIKQYSVYGLKLKDEHKTANEVRIPTWLITVHTVQIQTNKVQCSPCSPSYSNLVFTNEPEIQSTAATDISACMYRQEYIHRKEKNHVRRQISFLAVYYNVCLSSVPAVACCYGIGVVGGGKRTSLKLGTVPVSQQKAIQQISVSAKPL